MVRPSFCLHKKVGESLHTITQMCRNPLNSLLWTISSGGKGELSKMPGVPEVENTQYEYLRISRKVTQLLEGGLIARMIQKENDKVARLASGTKRRKGLPLSCILFYHRSIIRQKKRQRSSLLFGGRNEIRTSLFWCEPDDHQFSKASIPPCVRSSINPCLQIILVLNL